MEKYNLFWSFICNYIIGFFRISPNQRLLYHWETLKFWEHYIQTIFLLWIWP